MASLEFKNQMVPQEIQDCVKESVRATFSMILGSEPAENENQDKIGGAGVVGTISFVGDITWLLMLELPKQSAITFSNKFCGFEIDYDSPDMGDAVGELANVLAGDIVGRLSRAGIKVGMSLPTIMRGTNVEPILPKDVAKTQIGFTSPGGDFLIKLAGSRDGYHGRKPGT